MGYDQLIVERDGPVGVVRMNNPAKLNALSRTLTTELVGALEHLGGATDCRAILLTGEGRGFCVGADLSALQEPYLKGERAKLSTFLRDGYNRLIPLLTENPKPVVAAVNGVAAGAGVSLALACDLRIAAQSSSFVMAFVKIGLVPDSGAGYLLPRTIGSAEALRLALTGDRVDAAEALRIGLVSQVVPDDAMLGEAMGVARALADLPTVAIGLTKRLFQRAGGRSLPETLELEADLQDEASQTADHLEGVMAFLEKRTPTFTGT